MASETLSCQRYNLFDILSLFVYGRVTEYVTDVNGACSLPWQVTVATTSVSNIYCTAATRCLWKEILLG